jgi:predicted N-acetyltransferase YhbS
MAFKIEVNPAQVNSRALAKLYGKSGWGREEDYDEHCGDTLKATGNILTAVAYDDKSNLIGIARAFTDFVSVTWLSELLVDPDYRDQGVGTRLIDEIVERTRSTAFYTQVFTGTEGFFSKFNLRPQSRLVPVSRKPMQPDPA